MATSRRSLLTFRLVQPAAPVVIADICLARRLVHYQSCGDVCPAQAIGFAPRLGGPPLPWVADTDCTGCGACLPVCPVNAITLTPGQRRV